MLKCYQQAHFESKPTKPYIYSLVGQKANATLFVIRASHLPEHSFGRTRNSPKAEASDASIEKKQAEFCLASLVSSICF